MSTIQLTGSLPDTIREDTPLWEWIGQLRLSIDPALIRFVDLEGFGANFFDVVLDRRTGLMTITPLAMADFEWFSINNLSPTIGFSFRFFMTDGSIWTSLNSYSVALQNVDDTPPQGLSFSSGGTIAAGAAGANIGRLLVSDPDTLTGFTFTIREDDQWMFEIVSGMLKLRSGISIPLADGPERPIVITVSDGFQSAAFTLKIGLTAAGINNGGTVDLMELHETGGGFRWTGQRNLFSLNSSADIAAMRDYGSLIHIQMRDGSAITVEQPSVIELLDGYITFSGDGLAGRVWAIYETVLNREPRHMEMAAGVARLAAGATTSTLVGELLGGSEFNANFGGRSNAGFAEMIFRNSVNWNDQNGISQHTARLDQGQSRVTFATNFVNWRLDSLNHADQRAENGGFFVPRTWLTALDAQQPGAPDPISFGFWRAEQVITGTTLSAQGDLVVYKQGILAELGSIGTASRLERLFSDMTGAPVESTWATSFAQALTKTGTIPVRFLQEFVRDYDLDHSDTSLLPTGTTFQSGW
ncbi:hypothetical protein [Sediminicoccus sp. KRV36]|uniref:hypothetical protein n=1 Tax=Sediminicoccus sp. KRV36 TaxID=3133721 RepID=UPI00200F9B4C|nr:hypothetical protein [Sediminicoccus rosea]UPY37470.1 hypothetical protein LHU95_01915 [Sediminicoccus rosea]